MEILALTLLLALQTAAFIDVQPHEGVLINVPQHAGAQSWVNAPTMAQAGGVAPLSEARNHNLVRQRYDYSCGSASLTTLLRFYLGLNVDEQAVMNGMLQYGERDKIIQRRGFSLADMKHLVTALGYRGAGFRGEFADLKTLEQPAILRISYGDFQHFVVLRDIVGQRVFIADPAFGNLSLTEDEFLNIWDGILFLVSADKGRQPVFKGLELNKHDLAFMSEQDVPEQFINALPVYMAQQERNRDALDQLRLYRH